MRKLTAAQIAAMTTSLGLCGTAAVRLGAPLLALSPVISHAAANPDEIQTITVTASPYTLAVYSPVPQSSGGGGGPGTTPPPPPAQQIGSSTSNASTASQKQAINCAIQFSANVLGNGHVGPAPGYTTDFNNVYFGWGTDNPDYPATAQNTNPYQPPIQNAGYTLIDGYTSSASKTSTIWYASVAWEASNYLGVSAQTNLVNTLVHEWWHEWNGSDESGAQAAGDAAQQAYLAAGGDKGACNNP